jgi:hypothetical protein
MPMRLAKGPHGQGWTLPRTKIVQTFTEDACLNVSKIDVSPRLDVPPQLLIDSSLLTVPTPHTPLISFPELCTAPVTGALPCTEVVPLIKPVLVHCSSGHLPISSEAVELPTSELVGAVSSGSVGIFAFIAFVLLCLLLVGLFNGLQGGSFVSLFAKVIVVGLLVTMFGYGLYYQAPSRPEKPPLELEQRASRSSRGERFLERTSSPPV